MYAIWKIWCTTELRSRIDYNKQVMHDMHTPKPKPIHAGTWTDNRCQSRASRIANFPAQHWMMSTGMRTTLSPTPGWPKELTQHPETLAGGTGLPYHIPVMHRSSIYFLWCSAVLKRNCSHNYATCHVYLAHYTIYLWCTGSTSTFCDVLLCSEETVHICYKSCLPWLYCPWILTQWHHRQHPHTACRCNERP